MINSSNSTPRHLPKRSKNICPHINVYTDLHSSMKKMFRVTGLFSILIVVVTKLYTRTQIHQTVHFKLVNFIACNTLMNKKEKKFFIKK